MYPRGGNPLAFDHRGIAEEMRKSLYLMFNAHVVIYDPHLDAPKEKYDYKKDSGGVGQPEIVFDSGAAGALIHTLSSTDMPEVGGQTSGSTGIRLQVKEKVPRPVLHSPSTCTASPKHLTSPTAGMESGPQSWPRAAWATGTTKHQDTASRRTELEGTETDGKSRPRAARSRSHL
jgi:hypothetical protein